MPDLLHRNEVALSHFSQETVVAFPKASSSSLAAQISSMSSILVTYLANCKAEPKIPSRTCHIKNININIALGSLLSRGEYGLHEYTEVKTVTIKIPQKNS